MQPIDDVVYKLSGFVKRIILYESLALTLFEQHSYVSVMFHVQVIMPLCEILLYVWPYLTPVLSTCPLHTKSGRKKERRIFVSPW